MELDCDVLKLQGTLLSLESRGLLNESDCSEAVKVLKNLFESVKDDEIKSKMVFFMILNTDLLALRDVKYDDAVSFFICISPALNLSKTLEIIWELQLQKYFNGIIEDCPNDIVAEIIDVFQRNPKFWKLNDEMGHTYNVWSHLFVKIYISEKFHPSNSCLKLSLCFQSMYNSILKLLKISPGTHGKERKKLLGKNLIQFFNSILFMVKLYRNDNYEFKQNKIFQLDCNMEPEKDHFSTETSTQCLNLIFQSIHEVMDLITVGFWMSLFQFHLESNSSASFQNILGETIYYICEEIRDLFPDALKYLEGCKVKPKSDFEKITEAGIDEIISNVEQGKRDWFKALIGLNAVTNKSVDDNLKLNGKSTSSESVKVSEFYESKVIDCLLKHLDLADEEDINFILSRCIENFRVENQPEDLFSNLKNLFITTLKHVKENEYSKWLSEIFEQNTLISSKFEMVADSMEMTNFSEKLTQVFNRISMEESVELYNIVCLCLQSREKTLEKIFHLAINNSKKIDECISILNFLKSAFSCHPEDSNCPSLLENVLLNFIAETNLSEKEKNSLVLFLSKLGKHKFINWSFYDHVLSALNSELKEENYEKVIFLLKLMQSGLEMDLFCKSKSSFFASMCQILNDLSWSLESFSTAKSVGRNLARNLISKSISKLSQEDFDRIQVLESLSNCCEINQAYFCDIFFKFDNHWSGSSSFKTLLLTLIHSKCKLDEVLTFMSDLHNSKDSIFFKYTLILSLTMLLPFLVMDEWEVLFNRLKSFYGKLRDKGKEKIPVDINVVDVLGSAIFLLTVELNQNEKIFSCYEYCLRNFGRLINSSFIIESDSLPMIIFEKMIFFLREIDNLELRESSFLILSPIFVDLKKKMEKNDRFRSKIDRLLALLNVKIEETIGRNRGD